MDARHLLVHIALAAYPRDFRASYRAQILNDFEESNAPPLGSALGLLLGGICMRADLFARDVRYALRRLWKMPLFAAIVAATFALGIGANVAVFSILNAVLLRPLPYPNVAKVVVMRVKNSHQPSMGTALSIPELNDFVTQSKTLSLLAASALDGMTLTGLGKPRALIGYDVTPNYFAALGVRPQLGRFFTEADERKGVSSIIISDRLWRRTLGADPHVLGRALRLNGAAYTIVGVAAPDFRSPDAQRGGLIPADYWAVQPDEPLPNLRGAVYLGAFGILRPGASLQAANAELVGNN